MVKNGLNRFYKILAINVLEQCFITLSMHDTKGSFCCIRSRRIISMAHCIISPSLSQYIYVSMVNKAKDALFLLALPLFNSPFSFKDRKSVV